MISHSAHPSIFSLTIGTSPKTKGVRCPFTQEFKKFSIQNDYPLQTHHLTEKMGSALYVTGSSTSSSADHNQYELINEKLMFYIVQPNSNPAWHQRMS